MPRVIKTILLGLALLCVTGVIALAVIVVVTIAAGPSVSAGETAVTLSACITVILGLLATGIFGFLNRTLKPVWLILSTILFALCQFVVLAIILLSGIVALNR